MFDVSSLGIPSKTYPVNGPLALFRYETTNTFTCVRCNSSKTAKLVATVIGSDGPICNGCYGYLLSVWKIKNSDMSDEEKDAALYEELVKIVPSNEVSRLKAVFQKEDPLFAGLSQDAQQALATSRAVSETLRTITGLDWSAAIIGLCKAVEIEIARCIMMPLKRAVTGTDLSRELQDKHMNRIARFCTQNANPPELGVVLHFFRTAIQFKPKSLLIDKFVALIAKSKEREWLTNETGFRKLADDLKSNFRNPAAHTELLSETDYLKCLDLVQGQNGILNRLVAAKFS